MADYDLYQRPGSTVWYMRWAEEGNPVPRRISLGTKDHGEAKRRARARWSGHDLPAPTTQSRVTKSAGLGGVTLARILDLCAADNDGGWGKAKSQATVRSNVRILSRLFGDELISNLTSHRLKEIAGELAKLGYSDGTRRRKLHALSKALTWATENNDPGTGQPYITGRPKLPQISASLPRDRVIEDDEWEAIQNAIIARSIREPARDWMRFGYLLHFLHATGCRLGEALQTTRYMLDKRADGTVWVKFSADQTKSARARTLPLSNKLISQLYLSVVQMSVADPRGRLFPFTPASAWYFWKTIRNDVKKAGVFDLSDVVLHSFRHTRLTKLAQRTPIHKVSKWAGHSSIAVTVSTYAHLTPDDLLDLVDVVNEEARARG